MEDALFLIGRILLGGFFVYNGLNHFMRLRGISEYAKMKKVPSSMAAVAVTGLMLLGGGLSIILGLRIRTGVVLLTAFLIPVTLIIHDFWRVQDPQRRMAEKVNFLKNLALLGAILMLPYIPRPWHFGLGQ